MGLESKKIWVSFSRNELDSGIRHVINALHLWVTFVHEIQVSM